MRYAICHPSRQHYAHDKCKSCWKTEYERTNPKARRNVLAQRRRRYRKHRASILQRQRARYHADLQRERDRAYCYRLRDNFGMTWEDYKQMERKQKSKCAICGEGPTERTRLTVDHDHVTGKIRGLLCHRCNLVIGRMEDNPKLLTSAAAYLAVVRGERELTSRPPRRAA